MLPRLLGSSLRQVRYLPGIIRSSQRIFHVHHHEHLTTPCSSQRSFCTPPAKGEVIMSNIFEFRDILGFLPQNEKIHDNRVWLDRRQCKQIHTDSIDAFSTNISAGERTAKRGETKTRRRKQKGAREVMEKHKIGVICRDMRATCAAGTNFTRLSLCPRSVS